ncbi:MAG: pyridoxal phosphate-dependent aminotransferase [Spirochaetales bacterium]|nr:pyridoxal phosphate-dependent aminotransferase [Spirochaetales bacterium]
MKEIIKSKKLDDVCYDIRGIVLQEARKLETEGYTILKLNIGNPAPFGLFAPDEIIHDMILNLHDAQGYSDSKGLFSARKAVMQYCQQKRIYDADVEHIYVGNGVSELIVMSMQGLLDSGDEVLVPMPDYPLWTAAINLSGGTAVHYRCDEQAFWYPDLDDIKKRITPRTKALVVINPNNPTGSHYPRELLESLVSIARENHLIVYADEIYDKILYDGGVHTSIASLADDLLFVTFNGLSKSYRSAGFRAGWMVLTGALAQASDYIKGLDILATMRLCSNVPGQFAIQTALGGYQSIDDLVKPGGRLREQRDVCYKLLSEIPGISCVKPQAALYCFPKIDTEKFRITSDERFVLDFLRERKVLLVQGTGFNWPEPDHFRVVFLPAVEILSQALAALKSFLNTYDQGAMA